MPRSEERGGMAARSEAEANSLLVYKSPAWKGGVLYFDHDTFCRVKANFKTIPTYFSQGTIRIKHCAMKVGRRIFCLTEEVYMFML
jgi:hypothetical protein